MITRHFLTVHEVKVVQSGEIWISLFDDCEGCVKKAEFSFPILFSYGLASIEKY